MGPLIGDVTVNGQRIPAEAIAAEAQMHPAPAGKPGHAWRAAARALALRAVMLERARALGLGAEPTELAPGRIETEEEALIRALVEAEVRPAPVSEEALHAAHAAHPGRYRSPDLYEVSHILIAAAPGDETARAAARKGAVAMIADLSTRPEAFETLARERSDCPSGREGGRLGQLLARDLVPEFAATLPGLTPGAIAIDPVETRHGLHVLRLDAKAEGRPLPYEAVAPRLRLAAEKVAWAKAAQAYAKRLLAAANIESPAPLLTLPN
jgi:peptidyl-prolyl cis-trans isomerase C